MTQPKHATGELLIKMWDAFNKMNDARQFQNEAEVAFESARKNAFAACKKDRYTGTIVRGCVVIHIRNQTLEVEAGEILE